MPTPEKQYPTPAEVAKSVARISHLSRLTFEVDVNGWRLVTIHNKLPFPNRIQRKLSLLFFTAQPVIATPYLSDIGGLFCISLPGVDSQIVSWMPTMDKRRLERVLNPMQALRGSLRVGFRSTTIEADNWLRLQLAKAAGMRYKEHSLLTPGEGRAIFTREP